MNRSIYLGSLIWLNGNSSSNTTTLNRSVFFNALIAAFG